MRRNLYDKNCEDFIRALTKLNWREVHPHDKTAERHFRKNSYHLIVKRHSRGHYCVMHIDRFIPGTYIHQTPITKGKELALLFRAIIAEYKTIRGKLEPSKAGNVRQ